MKFSEFYKLLVESPSMDNSVPQSSEQNIQNDENFMQDLIPMGKLWGYNFFRHIRINGNVSYYLLDEKNINIILNVSIQKLKSSYEVNYIWKSKSSEKGLMTKFFKEFLIPKYKVLESSTSHSTVAKNFWFNFIKNNLGVYRFSFLNHGKNEIFIDDMVTLKVEENYIWKWSYITLRIYEK